MSVLIKGMAMPENCGVCHMNYDFCCCSITNTEYIDLYDFNFDPCERRLPDCPLVPIPDHGDLIDRDALFDANSWDWFNEWGSTVNKQAELVVDAPVVIPAERSEE